MAEVLERGDIYFFYRPKVEEESPEGLEDVQRFFMVLHPRGKSVYRLIAVGRKRLPPADQPGRRSWGFVEKVGHKAQEVEDELDRQTYQTKTRGERVQPAARPAGEGRYAIVKHDDHTHLAYALELPEEQGPVQEVLRLEEQGSYVLNVKNPQAPTPPQVGLRSGKKAEFPQELQERFRNRRFGEVDPPDFLDYEGAEILLIGAAEEAEEELDISLEPERETEASADIFRDLKLERDQHPLEPLFQGDWR